MGSDIVAFPLFRRQKLVRDIGKILQSKQGDDATLFWRETAKGLLRQLAKNGVPAQQAENEVRRLLYAVMVEIEAAIKKVKA